MSVLSYWGHNKILVYVTRNRPPALCMAGIWHVRAVKHRASFLRMTQISAPAFPFSASFVRRALICLAASFLAAWYVASGIWASAWLLRGRASEP